MNHVGIQLHGGVLISGNCIFVSSLRITISEAYDHVCCCGYSLRSLVSRYIGGIVGVLFPFKFENFP